MSLNIDTIFIKKYYALATSLLLLISVWGNAYAQSPSSVELDVSGRYLIIPTTTNKKIKGWGNVIKVVVDGVKIHQFTGALASTEEDVLMWGYLDCSEYVGKKAVISNVVGHPGNLKSLELFHFSAQIKTKKPLYTEVGRPQLRFSQKVGWNNDVNGMVYADGKYHLFWQSNPFGLNWGNMYWGHAVSSDLVHWEELPHAIRINGKDPKGKLDKDIHPAMVSGMAFSGGACVDHNNTLGMQQGDVKTIIATITDTKGGNKEDVLHPGEGIIVGESLAYSTDSGKRFTLLREYNPLISHHGRDPKPFWHEESKSWCIVTYKEGVKVKGRGHMGEMAFYSSKNLKDWTFNSFSESEFHECPDFIKLPVDGDPKNMKWLLFDATPKYQIGDFDGKVFTSDYKGTHQTIGGNLKAGQCFSNAPDGRAICMVWSRFKPKDPEAPFNQGFTLPLELSLRSTKEGVRCYANPVKELKALRKEKILKVNNKKISGSTAKLALPAPQNLLEVELSLSYEKGAKPEKIELSLGASKIECDLKANSFVGLKGRYPKLVSYDKEDGQIDLHLFVDNATIEVFAENGAVYFIHNRNDQNKALSSIDVEVTGGSALINNCIVHALKSIYVD
ncbi:MAG: glycoside hydrolase family 32 protein [Planctomycetes bacterium]|nr:glycoside hydrolase family 32 protein [Planctomycetota bacterium]